MMNLPFATPAAATTGWWALLLVPFALCWDAIMLMFVFAFYALFILLVLPLKVIF